MRICVAMTILWLVAAGARADELLPSRALPFVPVFLVPAPPVDFDLVDRQAEQRERQHKIFDVVPHSLFEVKRHIGGAAGFDNGSPHASIGLYLTVAEWGRWNFGVPAAALGFDRYRTFDERGQSVLKDGLTLIVSMASVHYRVGFLPPFGVNWYVNLEQVYDLRNNMAGSQFGLSFSRK
jgi:hypothetical protein